MVTPLNRRIAMHIPGQITWPEPEKGAKRLDCRFFQPERTLKNGTIKGRCGLVKAHQRVDGVQFNASASTACSMFEGAQ
jgi:hypothetical protein